MEQALFGRIGSLYFKDNLAANLQDVSADVENLDGSMYITGANFLFESLVLKIMVNNAELSDLDIFTMRFLTDEGKKVYISKVAIVELPIGFDKTIYSPTRQSVFLFDDAYVE